VDIPLSEFAPIVEIIAIGNTKMNELENDQKEENQLEQEKINKF
jgi:hypothetical protein